MNNARKLSLKRESLADLTSSDLANVAGGQALTHATCGITDRCTHGATFDYCPTIPLNECHIYLDIPATLLCK